MSASPVGAGGPARALTLALAMPNCPWEAELVAALTDRRGAARQLGWKIGVRRCLGLAELLADVGCGAAEAVVIDVGFPQLSAGAVAQTQAQLPGVVALCVDEAAERHARQLGFDQVVTVDIDDPGRTVSLIVAKLAAASASAGTATGPAGTAGPAGPALSQSPRLGSESSAQQAVRSAPLAQGRRRQVSQGNAHALPTEWEPAAPATEFPEVAARDEHANATAPGPTLGRLVAFWGPAGAPGRTTLALAVAHTVADRGAETIIIDGDSRAPGVSAALGLLDADSGLPTVANLADRGALNVHSLARHARQLDDHWRVLTGVRTPEEWRLLPAAAVEQVLHCARVLCDFVIVDVGPELERDDELMHDQLIPRRDATAVVACQRADAVVAVCGPEPAALARLCSRLPEVKALAPTAEFVVVVNRARTRLGPVASEAEIRRIMGDAINAHVEFVPDDQRNFDIATCRQALPTERFPRSPFATAVGRIADILTSPTPG